MIYIIINYIIYKFKSVTKRRFTFNLNLAFCCATGDLWRPVGQPYGAPSPCRDLWASLMVTRHPVETSEPA